MSDRMEPISFERLLNWIIGEYDLEKSIFGIKRDKFYYKKSNNSVKFLGRELGMPIGPAAGPNSQLAQNIVSAYLTGSRFIELKTVQILDGENLPVAKPCINAEDECYNVEWSTELTVHEAYEEYVKAWFLINFLSKELGLSHSKDFMFNMSVGYDLDGIKSKKIDSYIENLKSSKNTEIWNECFGVLEKNLGRFKNFKREDLLSISDCIADSITLSTLHGCPPDEIERIARYLLREKKLNTFIKLNPTLLGENFVKKMFEAMGYNYIELNYKHFKNDLQYGDCIRMLSRLKEEAEENGLNIGVKLSNTLPVNIENNELPGEEMYMSGRSLYPLTISLAKKLAKEFDGRLIISYSGGADFFNIKDIYETGICPITFATTILKPGGYNRIEQMAEEIEPVLKNYECIDLKRLTELADRVVLDNHYIKNTKSSVNEKKNTLPVFDCTMAPCSDACPINQNVPKYIAEVNEGRYMDAFKTIVMDNVLPSITGEICIHRCQDGCTRNFYESPVTIRSIKKQAADHCEDEYIKCLKPTVLKTKKKAVVIGAGPCGLSVAAYLRRNGVSVTVLEKEAEPFGIVSQVIPDFRISKEDILRDYNLIKAYGVEVIFNSNSDIDIDTLKENYDYVVLALGAPEEIKLNLSSGDNHVIGANQFLRSYRSSKDNISLGRRVVVVGGGNVAIDAARAAKRVDGVQRVFIVYRRTMDLMPAGKEEIDEALEEGIEILELLSPVSYEDNVLSCQRMTLGDRDSSGRRRPVKTGEILNVVCNSVISAIGEKIDSEFLKLKGVEVTERELPKINSSFETTINNVYIAGDGATGPKSIVDAMASAKVVAEDILRKEGLHCDFDDLRRDNKASCELTSHRNSFYRRKGILKDITLKDEERCLGCGEICELCVDVCPNRANKVIVVGGKNQILHIDGMCNECGNCAIFCPHKGRPYTDKFTLFSSIEKMRDSNNAGFIVEDLSKGDCIVRYGDDDLKSFSFDDQSKVPKEVSDMINAILRDYRYLLY